jgi:PAS domain S-box-containing protein
MPAKFYPFIDIAVHERVREHFTRGDAAVLFSPDMSSILWSNGAGATLFGFNSVYDFIDLGAERGDVAFRQLTAAARQLGRSGDRRTFLMRLASGFRSVPVNAAVEMITVQPGETAVLFSAPSIGKRLSLAESASRMISGLDDPDTHMAVLDADGAVLAASEGFADLAMTTQTCQSLVSAVSRDPDWLIKRPVATGKGHLPAAIGKLSDNPALHLLFAVETILGNLDPEDRGEPAAAATAVPIVVEEPTVHADDAPETAEYAPEAEIAVEAEAAETPDVAVAVAEAITETESDPEVFELPEAEAVIGEAPSEPHAEGEDAQNVPDETESADIPSEETASDLSPPEESIADTPPDGGEPHPETDLAETSDAAADVPPIADTEPSVDTDPLADDLLSEEQQPEAALDVNSTTEIETDPADVDTADEAFHFDSKGRAIRFVWKIDADGVFNEISEEFASAVGPRSADVVGRRFADLAERYGLDPENTITDLLKRRDTWSGKTVFWPVEGEALMVPVDLAALPTYSRNRSFDGFRGFGIVRVADAVASDRVIDWDIPTIREGSTELPDTSGEALSAPDTPEAKTMPTPVDTRQSDHGNGDLFADLSAPPAEEPSNEDPFRGELPALRIVDTPGRRESDKIVVLDSHRKSPSEALTRNEQAAFREIARQLGEGLEAANTEQEATTADTAETDPLTGMEKPVSPRIDSDEFAGIDDHTAVIEDDEAEDAPIPEPPLVVTQTGESGGLTPDFVDSLPVALLIHSGDTLYHANPEFLALTGYDSLDALDAEGGIDALFAGDDEGFSDLPAGTMMLLRNDGRLVNVTARLQSVRWQDKSALMLALAQASPLPAPVEEPVDAEKALPETAALHMQIEELHSILETATDGVVVIGADNEIRSLNRSASALFNYDDEEIRGKPFASLFAHESQKAVLDYLAGLSGHGVASVLNDGREVIGREASGGFIPLFMTMGRLASSNGYCAVIRDITQWKRTEEELRSAKRAAETANAHKTESLARISHEIRTPLNAIIGFSDMMASEHFGPIGNPRYVEYASDIGRSGRHVLDIVNDLLDISKIEAGEMELEFSAVEINEAISEAVSLVQPQANSQRVIIRTSLSTAVPNVVADSRSIKQMALNILSNAIRFTPAGGQIVVSTAYEANGCVILRIRDTGIGMTRSELEQAMKPFRQVTTGVRKRGDGTGLGLPLTQAMAEANRAQFSISSTPNEGTLVEVSFPPQRVLAN